MRKDADERTKRFLDVLFSREISKSRVINKDNTTRIDCASNRLKSSQLKSKKKVHRARGKKILSLSTTKTFFLFPAPLVGWVACPVLKEENFQQFMFLLLPLNVLWRYLSHLCFYCFLLTFFLMSFHEISTVSFVLVGVYFNRSAYLFNMAIIYF